jgi:uncharacterized delta-60 repeat protein
MADRFPLIIDSAEEKIKELVSGDNLDLTGNNIKNADYIQTAEANIAGIVTATKFKGDGSELENLPAAGSSLEATASGTLADGDPVIVNTDGTVSAVSQNAWIATPGGTQAQDMVIDSSGNIYVAGYGDSQTTSNNDGFLQKYNTAGAMEWQRYLGGGSSTSTTFSSVALDSSGNIYVAGYTNMQGAGGWDILVAKYNSSGSIQWQRILGGTSTDQSIGIAVDSSANVYISAYTQSSGQGNRDFLVAKYNTSGTLQWQYTLGDSYAQIARDIVVDSSGNFYVTGYNAIGSFPSYQKRFIVTKYNTDGDLQWQKVLYGSSDEDGQAIALDSSDNIYITGFSNSTGGGGDDIVVAKYNSSGSVIWQRKLSGSSNEQGNGIEVDSSGNVYVVGYSNSGGPGGYSIVIAKYNTSGTIQWQRHLGGSSTDQGRGIVVDNSGNFYICGNSSSTSTAGFIIARFPDDGTSTGTYGNLTYGDSSSYLTDGAAGLSEGTSSLTQSYPTSAGLTPATSTLNENASTLTPSIEASSSTLTAENYIGISDGAYTNGQTATIQVTGAVDDAQSSLTPGQAYYVQDDGTLGESGSVFAGTAVADTKLIVKG